jgi:hypothetical protein
MSYREERDALRARVEGLESELAEARDALAQRQRQDPIQRAPVNLLLGGPTTITVERELDGELDESGFEILVAELQRELGEAGRIDRVGGTWMWSSSGRTQRLVELTCRSHGGRTTIVAREALANFAGGIFGGVVGGVGGGGIGGVVPAAAALGLPPALIAVAVVSWISLVYVLVRGFYKRTSLKRENQLHSSIGRAIAELRQSDTALRIATPKRVEAAQDVDGDAVIEAEAELEAEADSDAARS